LKTLKMSNNEIEKITNPRNFTSLTNLDLSNNKIKTFDGSMFVKLLDINLDKNNLVDFVFPPNCEVASLNDTSLEHLCVPPSSLKVLKIRNTYLKYLPSMNNGLEQLDMAYNMNIRNVPLLPNSLLSLHCEECALIRITSLPQFLVKMVAYKNNIYVIDCQFPTSLKVLNLSENRLYSIPSLPTGITDVNISKNLFETIPNIPSSVCKLDIRENKFNVPSIEIINALKTRKYLTLLNDNDNSKNDFYSKLDAIKEAKGTSSTPVYNVTHVGHTPTYNNIPYHHYPSPKPRKARGFRKNGVDFDSIYSLYNGRGYNSHNVYSSYPSYTITRADTNDPNYIKLGRDITI